MSNWSITSEVDLIEQSPEAVQVPAAPKETRRGRGWIVFGVIVVLLIGFPVSIPLVNDAAAREVETRLLDLPFPDRAELIDSMAQAGKLVGNGNGMQYFAGLLIRSDQDLAELQSFYDVQPGATDLWVTVTPAGDIEGFHNITGFLARPMEDGAFVVQAWGNSPGGVFEEFDIRGH